ncbi:MAG: hypothetical protein OEM15_03330 [Myxococcales bacterium]|nr:hypothetical protein [Myxococcales bacterium]MDH3484969.1 hypothetical protein [Myxococcales bacterium]
MAEKDSRSRRDPSDLFKVDEATPSIAPVEKIVLPPEEALKRRMQRLALAGVAAVIFFYIGHLVLGWIHDSRLASALDDVIDDSSPATIDDALTLLRDDPNGAVRARLLATAALGGDQERLQEAEAILAEADLGNDPDARIARVYTLLARGDARGAHAEAERPAKYDNQAGAFLRGRATIAMARGQWAQALEDAKSAVDMRPGAPEPAALLALVTAQTDGPDAALGVLDDADEQTPATQIARARIVGLQQGNAEDALSLTESVREDSNATVVQKAWAELIEGVLAYRRGAIGAAYAHARAAAEPELQVDEPLTVGTAQLFLALGRASEARQLLKRLSSGPSADLSNRAHVIAWWYAQAGDLKAGLATLSGAGLAPEKKAISGFRALTIAELWKSSSRGSERERAAALYRDAAKDPAWGVAASNALARMLLENGDNEQAIAVLKDALATHPHHLTLVDTATEAYIASDQLVEADAVTTAALGAFDGEGWAHGSRARVLLAKREPSEAVAELDRAVELSPDDASLYALRGDAARAVGDTSAAKGSYEKALELDSEQPRALSGFLALLIDTGDFARAGEVMQQMDEAKVRDLRADEQRIRYLVRTGAGQSGLTTMRNAVNRHSRNAGLRLAAARVYLQAEQYSKAGSYYQQAKRFGTDPRTAETGLALAQIYDRRVLGAEKTLERAAEVPEDATEPPPPPSTLVQVWELVVKARLALADEKRGLAVRYAERASELLPNDADVFLLQADIEEDRERSPEGPLRLAVGAPVPMPAAAGRLAVLLGPTEDGCEMASRYLKANRAGRFASRARNVARKCTSGE